MSRAVKVIAAAATVAAIAVLAYALLTPSQGTDSTDHGGMWGMHDTYSSINMSLIAISIIVIVASLMVFALWREYEPLPASMTPPTMVLEKVPITPSKESKTVAPIEESSPGEEAAHNYLVLRLLNGDERTMYKAIMDAGGEILQKDLIQQTKMSNAKVSRVLDRLAAKEVITKERYGATNKIRTKLDR